MMEKKKKLVMELIPPKKFEVLEKRVEKLENELAVLKSLKLEKLEDELVNLRSLIEKAR